MPTSSFYSNHGRRRREHLLVVRRHCVLLDNRQLPERGEEEVPLLQAERERRKHGQGRGRHGPHRHRRLVLHGGQRAAEDRGARAELLALAALQGRVAGKNEAVIGRP